MAQPTFNVQTHAEDIARLRAGHVADDEAMRRFVAAPGYPEKLAAYLERNGARHARTHTAGPGREAVRVLLKDGHPDENEIRKQIAIADAHYWFVVQRHEPFLRKQAAYFQKKLAFSTDVEDVLTLAKLGAFAAAIRFDRDDIRFCTYAKHWIGARIQRNRDMPGAFRTPVLGWRKAPPVVSLEEPLSANPVDQRTIQDLLAAETASAEDETLLQNGLRAMDVFLATLPARHREILQRRAAGETFAEIGLGLGLSRERVRQIERVAMGRIRAQMGVDPSIPRPPPPLSDAAVAQMQSDRNARVVKLRADGLSYAKIGAQLGASPEWVRRTFLAETTSVSLIPPVPEPPLSVPSDPPASPAEIRPFRFTPEEERILEDAVARGLSVSAIALILDLKPETLRVCLRTHTPVYVLRDPTPPRSRAASMPPLSGRSPSPISEVKPQIQAALLANEPLADIAKRFGLSIYTVARLRRGLLSSGSVSAAVPTESAPLLAQIAPVDTPEDPDTASVEAPGDPDLATSPAEGPRSSVPDERSVSSADAAPAEEVGSPASTEPGPACGWAALVAPPPTSRTTTARKAGQARMAKLGSADRTALGKSGAAARWAKDDLDRSSASRPGPPPLCISESTLAAIGTAVHAGVSDAEIGARFGFSKDRIRRIRRGLGNARPVPVSELQSLDDLLAEMNRQTRLRTEAKVAVERGMRALQETEIRIRDLSRAIAERTSVGEAETPG